MTQAYPTLMEAARVWARIGLLSFGGPAGQIALMHRILVEERRWLGEKRFLHALNYCMLLPGPEAMQLSIYVGWLMHRVPGGIIAGLFFVAPGAVAILALSVFYALYGQIGPVEALFFGLKAAVLAIVLQAVVRIGSRVLGSHALFAIAVGAFLAIFVVGLPFPLIILVAGLIGLAAIRYSWSGFSETHAGGTAKVQVRDAETMLGTELPSHARPDPRRSLRIALVFLALWLAPVLGLTMFLGPAHVFAQIAAFFSLLAVVTFGGAYAVLAWVAQEAVQGFGWLAPGEMLDGLGLAETTPGPLILVTQFVGYLAAFRDPGGMTPLMAGILGAGLTTWVTFVPCFLWIFLGAPYIEQLRGNAALSAAMTAITAAVVGVILNLAVWFALHVVFKAHVPVAGLAFDIPVWSSFDFAAAGLIVLACVAAFRFRVGPVALLIGSALAGIGLNLVGLA